MKAPLKQGSLLIATVSLMDPNFSRTVVLLCEHQEAQGSYGLVLNRPLQTPPELATELPFSASRLFQGGPVQTEVMQILHTFGNQLPGSVEVLPGLWIGGDFEKMQAGFNLGTLEPKQCRFFLGYAGWGKGQLAAEVTANAWIVSAASVDLAMSISPIKLWAKAVRECGRQQAIYANFPEDPSWN